LQQVNESVTRIASWERQANILVSLTVLVGILGVVTGLLQKYDKPWCKAATVVIGALISAIMVINNTIFTTDYRTLKRSARQAREHITDVRLILANWDDSLSQENKKALLDEIHQKIKQIGELEDKMLLAKISIEIGSPVYAQSRQPSWVSNPPSDKINLYFVGIGNNPSLTKAKEDSYNDAVKQVTTQLRGRSTMPSETTSSYSLREYIKKSSETAGTYFTYDPGTKGYRYFTLLKLNRRFVETDIFKVFAPKAVVSKTTVEQQHRKVLGGEFQEKVAVYVGDIHSSKPFTLIIFETGPETASWQDATRLKTDEVRKKVPKAKILFDNNIDPSKPETSFSYNNQNYAFVGVVRASMLKDYLDFEIFRN
jgi:hypothetical protein